MSKTDKPAGDNMLSSFDGKMWALTYACLYRFHCPVIFKVDGPDAPRRVSQTIAFFLPHSNPNAEQVREFILNELQHEVREAEETQLGWFFGVSVNVHLFSGIEFYMDQEQLEALSAAVLDDLAARLGPKTLN